MRENDIVFFKTDLFGGGHVFQNSKVRNFVDGNFPIVELHNGHSFQLDNDCKWLSPEGWELQKCPVLDIDLSILFMVDEFESIRQNIK